MFIGIVWQKNKINFLVGEKCLISFLKLQLTPFKIKVGNKVLWYAFIFPLLEVTKKKKSACDKLMSGCVCVQYLREIGQNVLNKLRPALSLQQAVKIRIFKNTEGTFICELYQPVNVLTVTDVKTK